MHLYYSGNDYMCHMPQIRSRLNKKHKSNHRKHWKDLPISSVIGIAENYLVTSVEIEMVRSAIAMLNASKRKHRKPTRIMIDSGAFSAWNSGRKVNREKLKDLYKSLSDWLPGKVDQFFFVNLDVIPGTKGTRPTEEEVDRAASRGWENFEYFRSHGVPVIHVFHQHEKWEWLDRVCAESNYIGISPANDLPEPKRVKWVRSCFERIGSSVRCHGYAATGKKMTMAGPWYSVDSISWRNPLRFRRVMKPAEAILKGIPLSDISAQDMNHIVRRNTEKVYVPLQRKSTDYWKAKGVNWNDRDTKEKFWDRWKVGDCRPR